MLLAGTIGCKKKPADKKSAAAGEMTAGDMKAGDMKPDERPVAATEPEKRPVAATEPAEAPLPVDKEAVAEGVLSGVKGSVEVRRAGQAEFTAAKNDTKVFAKDAVRAGKDGEATMTLWDNSSVELTPESAVTLNTSAAIKSPSPSITVMAGAARFDVAARTEGQGAFSIYTPSAAVAVQGTVLAVGVGLSGNARVAVEEGKVEVTPVARVAAKPLLLVAGKVIIIAVGKPISAPKAYSAEKAGWDEWLEAEDQAAAKNADGIAALHSGAVETLNQDAATLENAEDTGSQAGEDLQKQIAAAQVANKPAVYKKVQPQYSSYLERQDAIRANLRLTHGRQYAHAYLLGLLAARINGSVYKSNATTRAAVLRRYQRISTLEHKWQLRRYKRRLNDRRRIKRMQQGYYLHHIDGRRLAPKMNIRVPKFYANLKPRRTMRRKRIVIAGYDRPLYRRPVYRGKRQKLIVGMHMQRNKAWYQQEMWKQRRMQLAKRNQAKRIVWRKQAMQRRARWAKRPAYHGKMNQMRRQWHRGVKPGVVPHGMMRGPGPRGMMRGVGPDGMMRGVGPHGMLRGVGPRGMLRGTGPRGMLRGTGPRGMVRGMRFGMRLERREKLRRMRRRDMGM